MEDHSRTRRKAGRGGRSPGGKTSLQQTTNLRRTASAPERGRQLLDFFAAFHLAHRALCADAIRLRAEADSVRFLGTVFTLFASLLVRVFAHLVLWAAAIRARPAANILRVPVRFPYAAPNACSAAETPLISLVNRSCSFFKS